MSHQVIPLFESLLDVIRGYRKHIVNEEEHLEYSTYGSVHLLSFVISESVPGLCCFCLGIFSSLSTSFTMTQYKTPISKQISLWYHSGGLIVFEFKLPVPHLPNITFIVWSSLSYVIGWRTVETCISLMGLYLIRMFISVKNKTDERDKREKRTNWKNSNTNFSQILDSLKNHCCGICIFSPDILLSGVSSQDYEEMIWWMSIDPLVLLVRYIDP